MSFEELLSRLRGVKRRGPGKVEAFCPAHDDREKQSLSAAQRGGRLLVHCHRGCSPEQIVSAIGWTLGDLFADVANPSNRRIIATYDYRDEKGALLFQVVRFEPKDFRQRRPDDAGRWGWNIAGVRRVLYRTPELIAELGANPAGERRVFVVEGEKDVETLRALGFVATCNPGGAGKWRPEYSDQLKAAGAEEVVVLDDNDVPGGNHVKVVIQSCLLVGLRVRNPPLPGLPPRRDKHGEDISDWLDQGHTRKELLALVATTPDEAARPPSHFHFVPVRDLLTQSGAPAQWLVEDLLPLDGISVIVGRPKTGKTTFCRALAAAVARGVPFLDRPTTRGPVLYASLEDGPRAVADHFRRLSVNDEPLFVFCGQAPAEGLQELHAEAERLHPVLIVVDTVFRLARVGDVAAYAQVLTALEPLLRLARELKIQVLLVHHAPKGSDGRDASDAPLGSVSIAGTADAVLVLRRIGDRRTLTATYRAGAGEDFPETLVRLDAQTGSLALGPTRGEADEIEAGQAILDYFASQSEPVEEPVIGQAVEGRTAVKRRALRRLVDEGKVARLGTGKRGDPYRYGDSRFLVPIDTREQGNKKPETNLSTDKDGGGSCSQKTAKPDSCSCGVRDGSEPASSAAAWPSAGGDEVIL